MLVYEAIEITEHNGITIILYQRVIRVCEMEIDPAATDKIQNVAVMIHVRFRVTVCLYLIPITEREVCPRLWPSKSTKTSHIMCSSISGFHPLRIDKDSSFREPRISNR